MRKTKKEAAGTRKNIVAAAADQIRRTGIAEASLADIMAAAGLTHGGFYRHFRSKEHVVAEAISAAGEEAAALLSRRIAKGGVNAAVDDYLSTWHRDAPIPICPFAALGSEAARSERETKVAATQALEAVISTLAGGEDDPDGRKRAIVAYCTMIGAMTLARIASGTPLSDEILDQAKDAVHHQVALAPA